jgi:hypothetical protein
MNTIPPKNRFVGSILIIAALGYFFAAVAGNAAKPPKPTPTPAATPTPTQTPAPPATPAPTPTPTPTCPLPENYGVNKNPVSPEKPLQSVCHNGKILCVPEPAANAHVQHGDTPLGPCSKQGNNGPCP